MNIELKPIAESKVRQLGGEVFGVVIRDKRGRFAAITEMGFVTWLDEDKGGEYAAYLEGMNSHLKAELEAARAQGACEWAEQLDACEFHGNDHEVCAEYSGQVPCARAQSGQGVEPEGEERLTDVYRRQLFECQDELNNLRSEYHNRTAELETEIEDLQEELQRVRRQADVPEGWRECLTEMVQAMHDYEMSVDEDAPYKHRAMMDRAHALLSATSQSEGDEWIRCIEKLPTEADDDFNGCVWARFEDGDIELMEAEEVEQTWDDDISITHWMPTGLKRPQPPAGQEGA